jgi:hypothetical protein
MTMPPMMIADSFAETWTNQDCCAANWGRWRRQQVQAADKDSEEIEQARKDNVLVRKRVMERIASGNHV